MSEKHITADEARQRIRDMVALANSGGIYDGNQSVIYMAHLAALLDNPAPARTEPVTAATAYDLGVKEGLRLSRTVPTEDRVAPTLGEVKAAIFRCGLTDDIVAAIEKLYADRPTVAEVKAEAWDEGWMARSYDSTRPNPYRKEADRG